VTVLRKQINPCSIYSSNSPHKDLLHNTVTTLFLDLIYLLSNNKKKKKLAQYISNNVCTMTE